MPASQVDRAVARIDELDDVPKRNAKQLVAESRGDGLRLIDEFDSEELAVLLRSDADFEQVAAKYGRLSDEHRNRFAALVRDDDLGDSWLRVVSDEEIPTREVETALGRIDEVSGHGEITEFHTGRELNKELPFEDPEPVHQPESIAIDYNIDQDSTYYRFYNEGGEGSDLAGDYTFRDRELVERASADDISNQLALPNDPDAVGVVNIRADADSLVQMRVSTTADNVWGSGGGTQYVFRQGDDGYVEDWFEQSEGLTEELRSS